MDLPLNSLLYKNQEMISLFSTKITISSPQTTYEIPLFTFTNDIMTRNQLNLVWNCTPIYDSNIKGNYNSDLEIVDKYMKDHDLKAICSSEMFQMEKINIYCASQEIKLN